MYMCMYLLYDINLHVHVHVCFPQVTGVRGLMARSVVDENSTVDGEAWHDSSSEPGWRWKGNTSSDEVVGHMFAYPLIYDLVAEDDDTMKEEVESIVDDIIGKYIDQLFFLLVSRVCTFCVYTMYTVQCILQKFC